MRDFLKNIILIIIVIIGMFSFSNTANASHVAGGYIQFDCTGTPGVYKIRLVLYRDCSGISMSTSNQTIKLTNTCGIANPKTVTVSYKSMQEVSQVCATDQNKTTCKGGTIPGFQEYIFEGTVNLGNCNSWTASYALCCRNNVNNVSGASSTDFYVKTQIFTGTDNCNDSPAVTAQPEPYVCKGQPVSYNLGAYEPDGDVIVYSLVSALNSNGNPLNYTGGNSGPSPVPGVNIDPNTGTVTWLPTTNGTYIFVIQMTEYDSNGNVVTVTNYEYQTTVITCSNQLPVTPAQSGGISNITGSIVQNGPNSLTLCKGFQGCFSMVFSDPDAANILTVTSNLALVLPGATITQTGNNPVTITVCWQPTTALGVVGLNFLVEDNACPLTGQNNYAATINVVDPGVPSVVATPELCGGTNQGQATITMSGGAPPFTYSISGPVNQNNSTGVFTNLPPGTYSYTVNTSQGCPLIGNFTLAPGPNLPVSTTKVDVNCNGQNNGSATVTPGGGTAPYIYVWSQGGTPIGQNTQTASNLTAGTYDVSVTDNNGCANTATVTIAQPNVLTGTLNPTPTLCNGASNGQISVTGVTGGTAPYTYSIDGGAYQAGTTFTGLAAGNHQVTIKDNKGCTLVLTINITQPPVLTLTLNSTQPATCGNNSGSASVTAAGGTAAYTYSIGGTSNGTGNFTNLAPGSHTINVTDANGCTASVVANITTIVAPTVSIDNLKQVSCFGGNDGKAVIAVSGAAAPVSYSLNGGAGQASNTFNNLSAGSYTVTITDANGCTATTTFTITQPPVLNFTSSITPSTCSGDCNGQIVVTAMGGTSPYTYSSNNGMSFGPSGTLTGLCAGNINVVVKDAMGCLVNSLEVMTQPSSLTATYVNTDPICHNGSDGMIQVNAAGGTPAYTYSVDGGAFQSGSTLTGLASGNHNVIIKDANGCQINATQTLGNPPGILIDTLYMTPSNCGFNDGQIAFTAAGSNPPFTYTWNGSTNATGVFTNQLAGAHLAYVTDALGCKDSIFFGINDIQMGGQLISLTNLTCFEDYSGDVSVINTKGSAPITFELDNSGTTQTNGNFAGLDAGSHIITIYDNGFCIFTIPFTLTQPDPVEFAGTTVDVSCNGGSTGQINVTNPTGGDGNYQYSIDGFVYQAGTNFSGLSQGDYTIYAEDGNGCPGSTDFHIDEAPLITFVTNLFDLMCYGDNTGAIEIVATGGTGTYTYSNDNGSTFQSSYAFPGLAAGTYNLVVKDAVNCQVSGTATINQPTPLTATYAPLANTCFNACDGQLTITANGGTTPYQYSIDNGVTMTTNSNITGICEGTYTVLVSDNHNCQITASQTITQPTQVTFTSVETPSTCSDPNGVITITASGGTPGYTYSNDNGGTFVVGNVFNGLAQGTYNLAVKDANGCPATGTQIVTDMPSPSITMLQGTDPLCNGDANGIINVTATGGTGTLTYSVDGGAFQASSTLNGLSAGSHIVTIQDANGCTDTDNITLVDPPVLTFTTVPTALTCFQNSTGKIVVTPNGGTPTYTYSFDNGTTFGASPVNNFIAAGTYNIVVKDFNNCTATGTETVTEPTQLVFNNITSTDALCFGSCDGTITLSVGGGTAPYTYQWPTGISSPTSDQANGLCAGNYSFIVNDANNCLINDLVTINQPDSVQITSIDKTNVTCFGFCDGTIQINSPTGVQFSIDNGANFQAGNSFTNLCADDYNIVVKDANGCLVNGFKNIWQADQITLAISNDTTVCYGFNAKVVASATGGIQPYDFQWSVPNPTGWDTLEVVATSTQTYTVDVFDFNGCTPAQESMTLTVIPLVDIVVLQDTTICPGGTATLTAQGTNGLPGYSYMWSNGETTPTINVKPSSTTTYTATVTDQCGDDASADAVVDIHSLPTVQFEADSLIGCTPLTVNFTNLTDPNQMNGNCVWKINGETITGCGPIQYTFTDIHCYDVTLQVESNFGCKTDTIYTNYICVEGYPIADFDFNPSSPSILNNTINFMNMSIGGQSYNWTFDGNGSSSEVNPSVTYDNLKAATTVMACLEVTSQYGCKDDICKKIDIKEEFNIYVPNTFTPDHDDYNEVFKPVFPPNMEMREYHMMIFNRWGEILFESYNPDAGWRGTYGIDSDRIVKDGTYIWKIEFFQGDRKEKEEMVGHVNVIK
ncbi:MAG: gliding motility-associated C-terminal domain-containing protein [Brumimicrobium sp.]|nr:gliding motility-associated C-terminal domain-containing protein [Brumimicrobium sp.]